MKILIVEDDIEIAALETDYLRINGYETVTAGSGMEALTLVRSGEFDLVILDIMLPGLDGFAVLKEIRSFSEIPVIILSARGEDIDKVRGLGVGADDYMQKPFSPGELVARVGAHLERYRRLTGTNTVREKSLTVRSLRLDKNSRSVFLHDEEKILTAREFDLMQFFMENPNRVFSKDVLFDKVWGMDSYGDSNTVVVHIKKIREKLEIDPQNPQFIETVWGAGYRMRI